MRGAGFSRQRTPLCDVVTRNAHHYTLVQTHRVSTTKNGPDVSHDLGGHDVSVWGHGVAVSMLVGEAAPLWGQGV